MNISEWKVLAIDATNTLHSHLQLPADWKEVLCDVHYREGNGNMRNFSFTYYLSREQVKQFHSQPKKYYRQGFYSYSSETGQCCIGVTETEIYLDDAYLNGNELDTTSYLCVWYR